MAPSAPTGSPLAMLAGVPLFSNLSKGQLKSLAESAKERTFAGGATIVRQGEKGIGFYLIVEGEVRVERSGQPVATLRAGQFFGEMALLDEQPRDADVRASGAVRCLVLSPWEFWSAVGDDPEALRKLLKETVRRLRSRTAGIAD